MKIPRVLCILVLWAWMLCICDLLPSANAALWSTDASGELTGTRTSNVGEGVTAAAGTDWDAGGFTIEWDILWNGNQWLYEYTVTATRKDISHLLLEVTDDGLPFAVFDGSGSFGEIKTWAKSGNQDLPNPLYGGKSDFGGPSPVLYTLITNRAPVYGVFWAKDGNGGNVRAWSSALDVADYKTNESLTQTDFIVRPDGCVPIVGAAWLLGSGLLIVAGIIRRL